MFLTISFYIQFQNESTTHDEKEETVDVRNVRLFHDDTFPSFYRRLDFSPDGKVLKCFLSLHYMSLLTFKIHISMVNQFLQVSFLSFRPGFLILKEKPLMPLTAHLYSVHQIIASE